ncbi:MAG: SUMF1/EgtB/PvdO family nonheme iron enzyme [Chloroflexota bacterium]
MARPLRVFLCHASQDKPTVQRLYDALKAETWIDPWLDKSKILPGQAWQFVIEKAVDESDVVIVCLSTESVGKDGYVQRELRYAYDLALEKPEGTIFLIPLRLDECEVPRSLRSLHRVDYFGPRKKSGYADLLNALKLRQEQVVQREGSGSTDPVIPTTSLRGGSGKILGLGWVGLGGLAVTGLMSILLAGNFLFQGLFAAPTASPTVTATRFATPVRLSTFTPRPPTVTPPTPGMGSRLIGEDGMTLLFIPAGTFTMGSYSSDQGDEKPEHELNLDAYWIDETEVTNAMYAECVEARKCNPPKFVKSSTRPDYFENPEFADYPVIYVTWYDAAAYCSWTGRRLPTEAEWEKAARGPDGRMFPWGNAEPKDGLLNFQSRLGDTTEVGMYPDGASMYGALDMSGNVWEWVSSLYQPYPYEADDGREDPNPKDRRSVRGGAWGYGDNHVRSAFRNYYDPMTAYFSLGFRCAQSP